MNTRERQLIAVIEHMTAALIAVADQRDALHHAVSVFPPPPEPMPAVEDIRPAPRPTYGIDEPPPIESELTDRNGSVWRVGRQPSNAPYVELVRVGYQADPFHYVGMVLSWAEALTSCGRLTLNDQDPTDEELYGPWGGRWGVPGEPCPIPQCRYGRNHTGPHRDHAGQALAVAHDEPLGPTSVTPHEAAEVICTCGSPAAHKVTCPRYLRMHPPGTPATHMVVIDDQDGSNDEPAF